MPCQIIAIALKKMSTVIENFVLLFHSENRNLKKCAVNLLKLTGDIENDLLKKILHGKKRKSKYRKSSSLFKHCRKCPIGPKTGVVKPFKHKTKTNDKTSRMMNVLADVHMSACLNSPTDASALSDLSETKVLAGCSTNDLCDELAPSCHAKTECEIEKIVSGELSTENDNGEIHSTQFDHEEHGICNTGARENDSSGVDNDCFDEVNEKIVNSNCRKTYSKKALTKGRTLKQKCEKSLVSLHISMITSLQL